jgi:hypothetical protein
MTGATPPNDGWYFLPVRPPQASLDLLRLVHDHPATAAALLARAGVTPDGFRSAIDQTHDNAC